jgi:hypothetical protein
MSEWSGSTRLDVDTIMHCARQGAPARIPRIFLMGRAMVTWESLPAADGEKPVWSARVTFTPSNQRGGASCEVRVYDRGEHREVVLECDHSRGLGSRSKNLVEGIAGSLAKNDPTLQPH